MAQTKEALGSRPPHASDLPGLLSWLHMYLMAARRLFGRRGAPVLVIDEANMVMAWRTRDAAAMSALRAFLVQVCVKAGSGPAPPFPRFAGMRTPPNLSPPFDGPVP